MTNDGNCRDPASRPEQPSILMKVPEARTRIPVVKAAPVAMRSVARSIECVHVLLVEADGDKSEAGAAMLSGLGTEVRAEPSAVRALAAQLATVIAPLLDRKMLGRVPTAP